MEFIIHPGQLGDAIHKLAYFWAKSLGDLFNRDTTIFNNIMKKCSNYGIGIQAEIG